MEKIKENIIKYKMYYICIGIIILSIISVVVQKIERNKATSINGVEIKNTDGKIGVYITGEIKNPGVYYLEEGSRLDSLIDIAGGITENADISKLNLSQKLVDSDKVVIYAKSSQTEEDDENNEELNTEETSSKTGGDCIDINNAEKEELMSLSGIGEATAEKIIKYRQSNEFESIDDIKNVSGIGDAKYNAIKDNICVD